MKWARFSKEPIIAILKEAEAGGKITQPRRVRQLKTGELGVRANLADQAVDLWALKEVQAKNGYCPRRMVAESMTTHKLSSVVSMGWSRARDAG
jgi:hypothetical protein